MLNQKQGTTFPCSHKYVIISTDINRIIFLFLVFDLT